MRKGDGEQASKPEERASSADVHALIELVAEENSGHRAGEFVEKLRTEHQTDVSVL